MAVVSRLGAVLEEWFDRQRVNVTHVAKHGGVSRNTIYLIQQGTTADPSAETLRRIARGIATNARTGRFDLSALLVRSLSAPVGPPATGHLHADLHARSNPLLHYPLLTMEGVMHDDETLVWLPKEPTWQVGDRVRVRLSAECPFHSHVAEQDGQTGYIDSIITQEELDIDNATATDPDDVHTVEDLAYHVYSVTYDDPRAVPDRLMIDIGLSRFSDRFLYEEEGLFLAVELERIS